jgi:hypothetical protein
MATYHQADRTSGGDYHDYFMREKAWEWVNMIAMFTDTLSTLRLRRDTAETGDEVVWNWMEDFILNGIHSAERKAEKLFLHSTDKDAYEQFCKSKYAEQRRRGSITINEYWQAFAQFLTEYEPF